LTDGTSGDIDTDITNKTALIRIMHDQDSDLSGRLARADQLITIAHEMVHLSKLRSGQADWQDESATNMETDALLRKHHRWLEMCAVEH
jgi:hypothetical protein